MADEKLTPGEELERQLEADLKVVKLENKLVKAKGTKAGPSRELKAQVRDARLEARAARAGQTIETDDRGRKVVVGGPEPEEGES